MRKFRMFAANFRIFFGRHASFRLLLPSTILPRENTPFLIEVHFVRISLFSPGNLSPAKQCQHLNILVQNAISSQSEVYAELALLSSLSYRKSITASTCVAFSTPSSKLSERKAGKGASGGASRHRDGQRGTTHHHPSPRTMNTRGPRFTASGAPAPRSGSQSNFAPKSRAQVRVYAPAGSD